MSIEDTTTLLFECGICMDNKSIDSVNFLPCIHFLCVACFQKLAKNECPFCRNTISQEKEEDSYDERENEYNDTELEMLVFEEPVRRKTKKNKKYIKKIMKLMDKNKEVYVSFENNTYRVLSNVIDD